MSAQAESFRLRGPQLSAGILSADLMHLGEAVEALVVAGVTLVHVDVMDGRFSPGLTVGPALVRALPPSVSKDVHLMVDDPLAELDAFIDAGSDILTFHVEATRHPHRALQALEGSGVIRGVALNPGTPTAALDPLLDCLELVLLLAVNPGWSGQSFIESTYERLVDVKHRIGDREILVGVDGAVTLDNIGRIAATHPDVIVAGSAIFNSRGEPGTNIRALKDAMVAGYVI